MRMHIVAGFTAILVVGFLAYAVASDADRRTVMAIDIETPTSTPTRRPTPIPAPVHLAVDCDVVTPGVQSFCEFVVGGQDIDVDVVLVSNGTRDTDVNAFGFGLRDSDTTRLVPIPSLDMNSNGNPDANDLLSDHGVYCLPAADTNAFPPPVAFSSIGCSVGGPSAVVAAGSITILASVRYAVPESATAGTVDLVLGGQSFFDSDEYVTICEDRGSADPCTKAAIVLEPAPDGSTATPTWTATPVVPTPTITPTPTSSVIDSTTRSRPDAKNYFVLDCDTSSPGVQQECHYPIGVERVDVAVIWGNNTGYPLGLSAFGFDVAGITNGALIPKPGIDFNWNANPDFNETGIPGIFECSPGPRSREDPNGSSRYVSTIGCNTGRPTAAWLHDGEDVVLATVHYSATGIAAVVDLEVLVGSLYNEEFSEIGSCNPVIGVEMPCLGTTIIIGNPPPTATPTASATPTATHTATNTPVATATNTPVPPTSTPTTGTTPAPNTTRPAGTSVPATPTVVAPTATSTPAPLTAAALRIARCVEREHGSSWRSLVRTAVCIGSHPRKT